MKNWERIQEVFLEASGRPPGERARYLDEACASDPDLRKEVESLLASDGAAATAFIEPGSGPTVTVPERPTFPSLSEWIRDLSARDGPPERVGPYRLLEPLGEGGMGIVYLAEQEEPIRRQVALKLIRSGQDTRQVMARFEQERQTLALMQHPNIAVVHDAGATDAGYPYFVMEYLQGAKPLSRYCDEKSLSVRKRLELFLDLCRAVQHAHQKGIIHRDLKPSNVLVGEHDGVPLLKVIDFGIAKAVDPLSGASALLTQDGAIIGTPGYMSPEQAEGGSSAIDTRTDIYSMGAILYELLVGTLPMDSDTLSRGNLLEIIAAIREKDPPTPSSRLSQSKQAAALETAARRSADPRVLERQIRGDLDWITLKALEKDPDRRYASAAELAADIERHLANEPVLARRPGALYRLRKFTKRNQWQVAAAAAVAVVLVGLTGAGWVVAERRSRDLLAEGRSAHEGYLEKRTERDKWDRVWVQKKDAYKSWQPPWERPEEMEAWSNVRRLDESIDDLYHTSVLSLSHAMDEAPILSGRGDEARSSLAALYFDRFSESEEDEITVNSRFFKEAIEQLGVEEYRRELEGARDVEIASEPHGAEVHAFRYEEWDSRLLPLAWRPDAAGKPEPFLRVGLVRDAAGPFREGDRLLALESPPGGSSARVRTFGELAQALSGVEADATVVARILRSGREEVLSWVPYPKAKLTEVFTAGRLLDPLAQFGFQFDGYPLDFGPASLLGTTGAAPFTQRFPRGSYLLVFRKPGFAEARVPLFVPSFRDVRAHLVEANRVPPGFIHIPDGPAALGAHESEAYEPLDRQVARVPGFLLARKEVTFREYVEFLNDPATLGRLATRQREGVKPLIDSGDPEIQPYLHKSGLVELLPTDIQGRVYVVKAEDGEGYRMNPKMIGFSLECPVVGLQTIASLEYARWLASKYGGRWVFRLPKDLEWEKAARGVDRRLFVWGDYPDPIYAYCNSNPGSYKSNVNDLAETGTHPLDESVYAILDLAGSAKERVLAPGRPQRRGYTTVRGGSWDDTDYRDFRAATRNRNLAASGYLFLGLRLAADLPRE